MRESVIRANSILFGQAMVHAEALTDAEARRVLPGQSAPPVWQIGHLLVVASTCLKFLGRKPVVGDEYAAMFGNGSKFDPDGKYPRYGELLKLYKDTFAARAEAYRAADAAALEAEMPIERMRERFPTISDALLFMMTSHEGYHFAQLGNWSRASK